MKPPVIVVGSMRMDKGESLEYAYSAVDRAVLKKPSYYTFDIIYTAPEDAHIAEIYIKLIKKYVIKKLPNATTWFGITNDFWVRPGAKNLFDKGIITEGDLTRIEDINPDREKNWT